MASDRVQFERALRRWDALRSEGRFSLPAYAGRTAVLYCTLGIDDYEEELEAFSTEAYDIADAIERAGGEATIVHNFDSDDMCDVVQDESVSDIVVIGNGTLSTVEVETCELDWNMIASMTTHLKTGQFIQRQCGNAVRQLNVPLGTFLMSRHDAVQAAFDSGLPVTMSAEDNERIRKLHQHPRLSYPLVQALFSSATNQPVPVEV